MAKLDLSFDITGVEKYKSLIELLAKHSESLPSEIVDAINQAADSGRFEYGAGWVNSIARDRDIYIYIDGKKSDLPVTSVNVLLKKVKHHVREGGDYKVSGNEFVVGEIYPKSFVMFADEQPLVKW